MKPRTENIPAEPDFEDIQISFGSNFEDEIIKSLENLDVNTLTPIEAMGILYDLANKAKNRQ